MTKSMHKHTHLQAAQCQRTNPSLQKSVLFANAQLTDNQSDREKGQQITAVWQNGGFSAKFNGSSSMELLCKTEHLCFDFRHFAKLQTVIANAKTTRTMIAKYQNIALLTVGNSALKNSDWADYANYCFDREKGLRKEAFKHLDNFLKSTLNWTFEKKIEFVKFLFPYFETVEDADYGPFPQQLSDKLIKPTLIKWCETETNDGNPFRWYGKYYRSEEHLFRALEINPADDLSRQTILSWWTYNIYYSVHHLPEGYIGEPFDDIKLAEKIKEQIRQLTTPELRENWTKELEEDLELVRNYIDWKTSGHSDFEKWGQENKKQTGYGLTRTYYYEK